MRVHTFTASNMNDAIETVRAQLGEEAVILSTAQEGKPGHLRVTAAVEDDGETEEPFIPGIASSHTSLLMEELEQVLDFHGILPEPFLERAWKLDSLDGNDSVSDLLEAILRQHYHYEPIEAHSDAPPLILVGPPGVGKTISIAKLATAAVLKKQPVQVITTDFAKAGGYEQIAAFTGILKVPLSEAKTPAGLKKIMDAQEKPCWTLIDSAGINPYDKKEIEALRETLEATGAEPVFTVAAGVDPLEVLDAMDCFAGLPFRRVLVTKTDAARRLGGLFSALHAANAMLCNIGHSSRVTAAMPSATPERMTQLLMQPYTG